MQQQSVYAYLGMNSAEDRVPRDLKIAWSIVFGGLVAAFPVYTFLVFATGMDRGLMADILAIQVSICYWLGPLSALLPLRGLRHWTPMRRIHMVVVPYLIASVFTHLIWEGLWVLLHESISVSWNAAWAYPWWGYIDGGDLRYYNPTTDFLSIEVLSVINGVIGAVGLVLLFRSKFQRPLGTMMVMAVAIVETVLTWYYYLTEILTVPHRDPDRVRKRQRDLHGPRGQIHLPQRTLAGVPVVCSLLGLPHPAGSVCSIGQRPGPGGQLKFERNPASRFIADS